MGITGGGSSSSGGGDVVVTSLPATPAGTNNIGDVDVLTLPATPAGTNNIGDVDVLTLPAIPAGANAIGSVTVSSLPATPAGANAIGSVTVTSLPTIPAGNNNIGDVDIVSGTLTTCTTVTTVTTVGTLTGSGVAHDGVDSGNPHKIGGKAGTADATAVANNDRADMRTDTLGHQVVRPYALHENTVQGVTAAIVDTTTTSIIAAGGAGIRNYVTSLTVTNSHATVSTVVEIRDGASTVIHRGYALAAGGGYTVDFPTPLRGTAATAINAACITTGSSIYVSASGYRAAV